MLSLLFLDVTDNKKSVDGPTRGNKKKRTDTPDILHSYTTIMVHLAFTGNKTNSHSHRWEKGIKPPSSAQGPLSSKIQRNNLVNFWKWRVRSSRDNNDSKFWWNFSFSTELLLLCIIQFTGQTVKLLGLLSTVCLECNILISHYFSVRIFKSLYYQSFINSFAVWTFSCKRYW